METLYKLFEQEKWGKARILLLEKLKAFPNDHWLLTKIGETYYEEMDYKTAFRYTKKAFKISPNCPLVLWDYAGTLDMLNKKIEAINIWKQILRTDISILAYGDHGEGLKWAQSLLNDCRFRVGISYLDIGNIKEANKYLTSHLKNRKRGLPSLYKIKEVRNYLNSIKKESRKKNYLQK